MMPSATVLTILLMAGATYLTRIAGYVLLRNRDLGPRAAAVMEAAPGCVFIAMIAPSFISSHPADLIGLAITLVVATRWPMLPTILTAIVATGLLRHVLG
ncbi:AzlD family protein [Methylobacterium sp. 77]|uniref:AzlD family protein n=1 Tax=Methylobacterium sp. 77 TaxID=1101192 RepID=UPI00047E52E0|nr:AzlD family protein [Methylobacterium sp. 77]